MTQNIPHVSVGMPVYNGERFVAQAVESILSQTFRDFELIISDNASTDATERICREYAESDSRIRYYRSEQNRGAAWNHNRVVELARGEYFKWQCHDDYCDPTFIEKCLAGIRGDPSVMLCYPRFVRVDEQGSRLGVKSSKVVGDAEPHTRHRSLIYRRDSCEEIYGIARTAVLRKTSLIGPYSNSDDTFLAELILQGRFREVPEPLFFYRIHPAQSTRAYPSRSDRMAWFKPSAGAGFSLPFLRLFAGHMSLVRRSPLAWREKVRCYRSLVGWFWYFRDWLVEDFRAVLYRRWVPWFKRHAPWTRPLWHAIKSLRDRLRRPESATARARRARRAQLEHWELEASYIKVGHTALFGRDINLWRQSGTRRFHAEITNGSADDTVWIELLYAGDTLAGPSATIPSGQRSVNTIQRDYFYGEVRACGKAGDRNQISCTLWHGLPGFIGHRQSGVG